METALNSAVRKVGWRFMPLLLTGFVLSYMDRNSIGFAGLTMNKDLGMTASQFGLAAGIFFISYSLCEVPSNVIQYRIGARLWLSRIMITWGIASAATALVVGPKSFYAARFILGIAEAGFFPGVAYFLAAWFPERQRTRMYGWLLLGIPLSSVIAGPICSLLLELDGLFGVAGWKWMFVIVSLPCSVLGVIALKVLRDSPAEADFLTDDERQALQAEIAAEQKTRDKKSLWGALKDPRVLILAATHFGFTLGSYAITIWLPQIIKEFHLTNLAVGFTSSAPYIFSSLAMLVWCWWVDRRGKTIMNIVIGCALAAGGLWWAVVSTHSLPMSLAAITVGLIGVVSARALLWSLPSKFLTGLAASGGIAFINTVGTTGGFVGPYMMGVLKDATGSFQAGIAVLAGIMMFSGVCALSLKLFIKQD